MIINIIGLKVKGIVYSSTNHNIATNEWNIIYSSKEALMIFYWNKEIYIYIIRYFHYDE